MKEKNSLRIATVVEVDDKRACKVEFDGEEATQKKYASIYGVVAYVGNRVLMAKISGTYLVIGVMR